MLEVTITAGPAAGTTVNPHHDAVALATATAFRITTYVSDKAGLGFLTARVNAFTQGPNGRGTGVTAEVTENGLGGLVWTFTGIPMGFAWHWTMLASRLAGRQEMKLAEINVWEATSPAWHAWAIQFLPSAGTRAGNGSELARSGNAARLLESEAWCQILLPIARAGGFAPGPSRPGSRAGRPRRSTVTA